MDNSGDLYLSTLGVVSVGGISGEDEDIFVCNGLVSGPNTSCASWSLFFDGSMFGLRGNDVKDFELP